MFFVQTVIRNIFYFFGDSKDYWRLLVIRFLPINCTKRTLPHCTHLWRRKHKWVYFSLSARTKCQWLWRRRRAFAALLPDTSHLEGRMNLLQQQGAVKANPIWRRAWQERATRTFKDARFWETKRSKKKKKTKEMCLLMAERVINIIKVPFKRKAKSTFSWPLCICIIGLKEKRQ